MLRAIGLMLALLSAAAQAAAQRTTQEMRDLPPREVKQVLRDDLVSILAVPGEVTRGMRGQLGDTAIPTRPVGSGIEGLCQRDLLLLYYAPTRAARDAPPGSRELGGEPGREGIADLPVRPYGVEAERHYFFTQMPRWESLDENRRFRSIFSEDCSASAGSIWEGWFTAPSPGDAVAGYLTLQVAAAAVAAGRVPLSGCEEGGAQVLELCRFDLARIAANPKSLTSIGACPAEAGRLCYALRGGMVVITIVARDSRDAPSVEDVISVAHEEHMIVT
jgi:hypothetical protein